MQDGKALQAGTSHNLGQNFSQSCGIKFQGRDEKEAHAYTTSWGISTRLIGGMIMTHGDDDGMIMPPKVAPVQVQIIPITKGDDNTDLLEYCFGLREELREQGLRVNVDDSDARTPDKMWGAVKKGIPVRVEIGGREMEAGHLTHVRRDIGKDSKETVSREEFLSSVQEILDDIQGNLLNKAREFMMANIKDVGSLSEARDLYADGHAGFVRANVNVLSDPEFEKLKDEFKLTPRVMPFDDKGEKVIIGKAY